MKGDFMPAMSEKGGPRLTRRQFLRAAASLIGAAALSADCAPANASSTPAPKPTELTIGPIATVPSAPRVEANLTPSAIKPFGQIKEPIPTPQPDGVNPASLNAESRVEASSAPEAEKEPQTLREWAHRAGFNIGVWVGAYGYADYASDLFRVQTTEFNLGNIQFGMSFVHPERKRFDFSAPNNNVRIALANDMKLHGQHLVWGAKNIPRWFLDGQFSRDERIEILEEHIITIITKYKNSIKSWVVVNEYDSPYSLKDTFLHTIGPEYLEIAFRIARDADPSAILIYNDGDNHTSNGLRTQRTREIVDRLRSQGLIDAVGLQMHIRGNNPPQKEDVIDTMRSYGLPVYVTEFDVNMHGVQGTQEERFQSQAQIYKEMLSAAIGSGVCNDFIVFGTVDKLSWLETEQKMGDADPLIFDDNFRPKPAYYALKDVLQQTYAERLTNKT